MEITISFAGEADFQEVKSILTGHDMDVCGDINEHVVVRVDGEVLAAAKVSQKAERHFHLEVIGVKEDRRKSGLGGLLLSGFTERPWRYCRYSVPAASGPFWLTAAARGNVLDFYRKYGFSVCSDPDLVLLFQQNCNECPNWETCEPRLVVFKGEFKPEAVEEPCLPETREI